MSSTGFLERAIQRGSQALKNLILDYKCLPEKEVRDGNGRAIVLPEKQAVACVENQIEVVQAANVLPPNVLVQGGNVDFRIPCANLHIVNDVTLQLGVSETGGVNPVTLTVAQMLIDRVEIYGQMGNRLIDTITGEQLFFNLAQRTADQITNMANVMNTTAALGAPTAIAAGGSAVLAIPVDCFISQCDIFMPAIESDLLIRFILRSSAMTVEAGTGVPSLTSANLRFRCTEVSNNEYSRKIADYRRKTYTFRYLYANRQTFSRTLAASAQDQVVLSGLSGLVAYWVAVLRTANPTGSALRTFNSNLQNFALLDSAGRNVSGGQLVDFRINRYINTTQQWDTSFWTNIPAMIWSHAKDPAKAFYDGQNTGFMGFDALMQLQYNTSSTITPGNFQLDVYSMLYGTIEIRGGDVFPANS